MKLSAPIFVLKKQAKDLKKSQAISLNAALDLIAKREGFNSWSLLQSKSQAILPKTYSEILDYFNPGDLIILASRPTFGKTTFSTGLLVKAVQREENKNYYFTLSEVHKDIAGRIANFDPNIGVNNPFLELDYSDQISADYIIEKTKNENLQNSLLIIDYLQLLDQQRSKPELAQQIQTLKDFAVEKGCIILFLSQVNRNILYEMDQRPDIKDIFLPNEFNLDLINKIFFLYRESTNIEVLFKKPVIHKLKASWDSEGRIY